MEQINTDICIIGAGSGGLSIAAGAVQMGARVVLVEAAEMGGDCLNAGCVPSKALIAAAKQAHAMTTGAALGIAPVVPEIDFAKVKDHVAAVIAGIAPVDSQERFEGLGVRVIREWGKFTGQQELTAGNFRIKARRYVVATGSRPFVPPIPGIESVPYLTNETIFAQRERPAHLIVIGGGPIGMEMAQAHRRLGCEVTVIEGAKAFGRDDPEAAAVVLAKMRGEGVTVMEDAPVVRVGGVEGAVEVEIKDGRVVNGSHLLMAVGRQVSLDGLGLEAAGVEFTRKGVTVGRDLRSSNRKIYAVGDAAGGLQFTHVAGYHAGIVIRQMLFGLPSKSATAHIPWATYTDPELAQVGPTEAEARKTFGDALTVVRFDYAENDRAQAERKTEGFVKVMVVKGRPIGATLVGAQAGELIGLWAMAIAARLKMAAVAGTVLPYPTLGEVSKRAAGAYFSPVLFDSPMVKRVVGLVQRYLP
ncbi:dihydrolipoyl dehydrogenase family protein [Pseudorhodobacter wandonensis]|uniref:dihydrolipoyl dehydrogenase family protein n=1 Tax=Pseudorhodobacter wandonensis TaxID=1120568 RepID=UPI00067C04D5|nr:FAD-dependent oxidoreductase [Pseudorhodobacter wandonensis]